VTTLGVARRLAFLACTLAVPAAVLAQISPGELSAAHASLEGMENCTKCHSLGKTVANDNCLACHTELRTRISGKTGFHAGLADRQCVECHKEHHGRTFAIVHFDTRSFDHTQTGFNLEGKHQGQACEKCHVREKIQARDVLQNKTLLASRTYLGLSRECRACHADVHKAQLGNQCQQCHTPEAWKPAGKFVHDRAKFRLAGKHLQVQCGACHRAMADDHTTIQFVGLEFSRCTSCHADPHRGKFQKPCESCHSTSGWKEGSVRNFDHATTRFPLIGLHVSLRCEACHVPTRSGAGGKVVQSFEIKKFKKCADCHADAHRGEFAGRSDGGACESCHNERGFTPAGFAHASTRYPLVGKHASTECRKCHGATKTDVKGGRIPPDLRIQKFQRCADCHEDAHGGQYARRGDKGACESCHAVEGFMPTLYSVREHAQTRFVLTGGHAAVPCAKCHPTDAVKAKSTRRFVWDQAQQCASCHKDVHGGQFAGARYAGCESCHTPGGWKEAVFAHEKTDFPLTGKHTGVACAACHTQTMTAGRQTIRRFAGTPTRCIDCHPQGDTLAVGTRKK